MTRTTRVAASAVLALMACGDGQTGSSYRGEPLMSLSGVVTSSESALTQDLVPALSFIAQAEHAATEGDTFTTHFVKSEVDGTFPSAFTMRIYEPPPSEVMEEPYAPGEPAFAGAQIVAVSPDHPQWLRNRDHYEAVIEDGVEVGSVQRNEVCDDSGECISGYPYDCPMGARDPGADWPCGAEFPDNLPWEVYGYSASYAVVYFEGDVAEGTILSKLFGGGALASGYHAVRYIDPATLSAEEQAANLACSQAAYEQAIDATNAIYGTSATPGDQSQLSSIERQLELSRQNTIAFAEQGCEAPMELITNPESDPIELPFTDEPQDFLW